jgi:putative transposase
MKLIRTIKIKLQADKRDLLDTILTYTKAYNIVCQVGYVDKDFNGVSLHHKTYKNIRESLKLPAQLTISSRMKATESLKNAIKIKGSCPKSKLCSIRYDDRSFSVNFIKNEVSLLTLQGRKKFNFNVPEYFKKYIDWKRCSADLFIRKNKVFLNIVFEKEQEEVSKVDNFVGIDRGMNKLCVTSNKNFYGGGQVKLQSDKIQKLRTDLQKCGTKSAKRHLKKISKKENRFRTQTNHIISKTIINDLPEGSTIILEDLSGLHRNAKQRKKDRREFHSWAYYQLEQFLIYKGLEKGISVVHVDARYTSQKCSQCGSVKKSNRKDQSRFKCRSCGYELNADLNAAKNIRQNYLDSISYPDWADVNRPIV